MKDKRWHIVLVQTKDGKLHEVWQWQLDYYTFKAKGREGDYLTKERGVK